MAIEKILSHFKTQENFEKKLEAGEIDDQILAFIQDTQKIWTHGTYFSSLKEVLETLDIKIDINTLLDTEIASSVDYFVGIKDGELKLYKPKDVSYYLESSEAGDSVVVIDGEEVTISAGTGIIGICTSIDFPLGTDNLETIYVKGDVNFSLSPQDELETEENNTLQSLRVIYSDDFERSYDQFCHGFDALKTARITGSKPTSLYRAFRDCLVLESLTFDDINVDNLEEVHQICNNCSSLTSFKINNATGTTSKIVNIANMFNQAKVETLDLSWINDTSNVEQCNAMLYSCDKLKELTIGDWDFKNCTKNMNNWMYGCTSLTTINGSLKNIMLDVDCSYSPLDRDSAMIIINGLNDYSGGDAHTVTFSDETRAYLTDDDVQIATDKNWNVLPEGGDK